MECSRLRASETVDMPKQLFGTDGIRGVPGEYPLDDATLDRVGLALGTYLQTHGGGTSPSVSRED
jgi:phosphomannomutase